MADTGPHAVSATDATADNPPDVPIAVHLPTLVAHLNELGQAIALADGGSGDYLAALEHIESIHADLVHIASDAESTARMPLGICGARMSDATGPWTHHYVCTKAPGHGSAGAEDDPEREHEDGTRHGAPAARWFYPANA